MRILIITQYFWPEVFRINDLAIELQARGHKVKVLTGLPNYPGGRIIDGYRQLKPSKELWQNIEVLRVPLIPRSKGRAYNLVLNYLSFALSASIFGPLLLKGADIDLILVFQPSPVTVGLPAMLLKFIKKAPLFFWVQDLWPESLSATNALGSKFALSLVRAMVRMIYHSCDTILVQSKAFIDSVRKLAPARTIIHYFPNWAEDSYQQLSADQLAATELDNVPGFKIIFAGNLGKAQGLEVIICAADILRAQSDIKWVIIGDGRERENFIQKVASQKLTAKFIFIDRQPMELMPHYFYHAGALLVTLKQSFIFSLTIPSKVQSYMACAKPILAALDGEGARIVNQVNCGYASPAADAENLAANALKLYHLTPKARKQMGERGKHYAQQEFNRADLISKLEGYFTEILDKV